MCRRNMPELETKDVMHELQSSSSAMATTCKATAEAKERSEERPNDRVQISAGKLLVRLKMLMDVPYFHIPLSSADTCMFQHLQVWRSRKSAAKRPAVIDDQALYGLNKLQCTQVRPWVELRIQ